MRTVDITTSHGERCTCTKLDPIIIQPVVAAADCPGRIAEGLDVVRKLVEPVPIAGRLILTWPMPFGDAVPLNTLGIRAHDYDTGKELLAITCIDIRLGSTDSWICEAITADLAMALDEDGQPLGAGKTAAWVGTGDDKRIATGWFRYEVVEMRIAAREGL